MKPSRSFGKAEGNLTLDRRARIIDILEKTGRLRANELGRLFNVSQVTIRNDLDKLEEKGLLIRTRGGAIRSQHVRIDYQLNSESTHRLKEKRAIGRRAASLVREKDTILFDSGTTTLEVARNLAPFKDLTVITNALNIASQFTDHPGIKVILLGGSLRQSTNSLIGPIAEDCLRNLYCDKVFLGVNGIDSKYGISTTHLEDAHLNKLMMSISQQTIVVTDSSKFSKRSFSIIAPISAIDTVVTDAAAPDGEVQEFRKAGVDVIVAD